MRRNDRKGQSHTHNEESSLLRMIGMTASIGYPSTLELGIDLLSISFLFTICKTFQRIYYMGSESGNSVLFWSYIISSFLVICLYAIAYTDMREKKASMDREIESSIHIKMTRSSLQLLLFLT